VYITISAEKQYCLQNLSSATQQYYSNAYSRNRTIR